MLDIDSHFRVETSLSLWRRRIHRQSIPCFGRHCSFVYFFYLVLVHIVFKLKVRWAFLTNLVKQFILLANELFEGLLVGRLI